MRKWSLRTPCRDCGGRGTLTLLIQSELPENSRNPCTLERECPSCRGVGELHYKQQATNQLAHGSEPEAAAARSAVSHRASGSADPPRRREVQSQSGTDIESKEGRRRDVEGVARRGDEKRDGVDRGGKRGSERPHPMRHTRATYNRHSQEKEPQVEPKEEEAEAASNEQQPPSIKRPLHSTEERRTKPTQKKRRRRAETTSESEVTESDEEAVEEEAAENEECEGEEAASVDGRVLFGACYFCKRQLGLTHRYRLPSPAVTSPMGYHGPLPDGERMCVSCYNCIHEGRLPIPVRKQEQPAKKSPPAQPRRRKAPRGRHATPLVLTELDLECSVCDRVTVNMPHMEQRRVYKSPTSQLLSRLGYDGWLGVKPRPELPRMCSSCYSHIRNNRLPVPLRHDQTASRSGKLSPEEEKESDVIDLTEAAEDDEDEESEVGEEGGADVGSANMKLKKKEEPGADSEPSDEQHDSSKAKEDNLLQVDDDLLVPVPLPFPDTDLQYISLPVPFHLLTFDAVKYAVQRIAVERPGRIDAFKKSLSAAATRLSQMSVGWCGGLVGVCVDTFVCLQRCWVLQEDEWVKRWYELLRLWLALVWLHQLDGQCCIRAQPLGLLPEPAAVLTAVRRGMLPKRFDNTREQAREINQLLAVTAGVLRHASLRVNYVTRLPFFRIQTIAGSGAFEPSRRRAERSVKLIDRAMTWMYEQRVTEMKQNVSIKALQHWLAQQQDEEADEEEDGQKPNEEVRELEEEKRQDEPWLGAQPVDAEEESEELEELEDDVYMDVGGAAMLAASSSHSSSSSASVSPSSSPTTRLEIRLPSLER